MKKTILLFIFVIFLSSTFFSSSITRGPEVGEIYYIGPTATGEGIYHSTDFGETATCMDSTLNTNINFGSITADLTPGVLYGYASPENLFISYDYGQEGSWIFRSNDYHGGNSGRDDGYLYSDISKHSEDYGNNFINHSLNGFFGLLRTTTIDCQQDIGYCLTYNYSSPDTVYLLITYDNFENLEIQNIFSESISSPYWSLSRGYLSGELFMRVSNFETDSEELYFSVDFGENWEFKNSILSSKFTGGRQIGELYILATYTQLMGEIKHTYIYHSVDYGETFTIYHPFAYGPDPYFANFDAEPTTGTYPLTVQFTDLSSGDDIQNWEWDFDNDGTIDSYEQNPEYTYQDIGYYNVKLNIQYGPIEDSFVRINYIHVTENNSSNEEQVQIPQTQLSNYPNPFNPNTMISYSLLSNVENPIIEIYNLKGQKVDELAIGNQQTEGDNAYYRLLWNAEEFASGVYLYKLNVKNSPIKKMILIK